MIIRRPIKEDLNELDAFFSLLVTNTFSREGLAEETKFIQEEIELKQKFIRLDLETGGRERYFLLALKGDQIVGTIEFGKASRLIDECTNGKMKDLIEIGTLFVHPDEEGKGIASLLLEAIFRHLKQKGFDSCCLDSGYTNAQKIWQHKFGEPSLVLKDYWGKGFDHMVWKLNLE